ncbi:Tigger transposable element-derived protein 6 [Araneus ventricosus]|uniref:Tigger transposable element-derived protein 6 n=1 Tax=Araneus ventricosus TaxID=182803 RepID=A0A4Y2KCJ6_ARAVE|nr:Tigger transposable element-derived protein 6 [Araneus ventricosus]
MRVDKGVKKKNIALKFGTSPNSLSTIIKNRDEMQNYDSSNSCSKRLKTCVYEDMNETVLKWIHKMRDKNVPNFGPFIIEKALQFVKSLGYDEFRGSNGWLEKFKRRHGIMANVISGESKDVDDNDNENWITETLNKILKDYKPENRFNADEIALFFQCLPQKTLTFEKEECFGGKQSKFNCHVRCKYDWTSELSEEAKIQDVSKAQILWRFIMTLTKKSWMTSEICEKWVQKLDKRMITVIT